jgi:SAM-dependent methyltransferase
MVSAFNKRATDAGIPRSQVTAVVGNLFTPEPSDALAEPEYFNFDIVAVGSAYHHFEDVTLATKRLVERLKPGGVLFIIDFIQGAGMDHSHGHGHHGHVHHGPNNDHDHGHAHHAHHGYSHTNIPEDVLKYLPKEMIDSIKVTGFDEARVRAFFEEAGLVEFAISVLDEKLYMEYSGSGVERTVFFAKGTKPVAQDI